MIYSIEKRVEYINKVINEAKPIRTKKMFYKGESKDFPVYRLDLRYLIFNQFNDRIAVEMRTRAERLGTTLGEEYTDYLDKMIEEYLWNESVERNKHTQENLKTIGQQEAGVVTLDGVIIDGNRRFMLLRRSGYDFFEAVVLKQKISDDSRYIRELETQIQFGSDEKVDYEPINKYLKIKNFKEAYGLDESKPYKDIDNLKIIEKISKLFNEKNESKIIEYLEIMKLMDEYLVFIGAKGIYTLLKKSKGGGTHEGAFRDLWTNLNVLNKKNSVSIDWVFDELDVDSYKIAYFNLIRSECDDPKEFRKLAPSKSRGAGVFSSEETFRGFIKEHDKAVSSVDMPSIDEYLRKHKIEDTQDIDTVARQREAEWQQQIEQDKKSGLKSVLKKTIRRLEDDKEEKAPGEYLKDALKQIEKISDDHLKISDFISDPENFEIVRKINKICFEIKKIMEKNQT